MVSWHAKSWNSNPVNDHYAKKLYDQVDWSIVNATGTFFDCAMTKGKTNYVAYALRSDGVALSFGENVGSSNLLGSSSTAGVTGGNYNPNVVELPKAVTRLDAGVDHAVALCEDGNLYAWGSNAYGQLGLGDTTSRTLPTLVPFFTSNTQYSFVVAKGESYEGSFNVEGMNSYIASVSPSKGGITLDKDDGTFTYTPNSNATGADYFEIEVSDGVNKKTYIVNVAIDYKPTWQNFETSFVVKPGKSFSSGAPATDQDGDALRYSIVQHPTQGEVSINENSGTFVYTANGDGAGDDSFRIAATDGFYVIEKTINVHVETPIVVSDIYERAIDVTAGAAHFTSQLVATDADGDLLAWSLVKAPVLGSLDLNTSTGAYTYDAAQGVTGDDCFTIQVTDGVVPVQKEYTIHLYSIQDKGTVLANVISTGVPLASKVYTEAKNTAVSHSIKKQGDKGTATIDSTTGEYVYAPKSNARGQDSFIVSVTHAYGQYELEIHVYMNTPPDDALVTKSIVVAENGSFAGSIACTDLDAGDVLSYQMQENPTKGNVDLNSATGAYVYTPSAGLAGNDFFSVRVSDGCNTIIVCVQIHIESAIQTEANVYRTISQNVSIQGSLSATDKDGDALSFSMKSGALHGVSSVSSDGSYSYTPENNFYGDDSFVATVTDGVSPVDIVVHIHVNRKPIVEGDVVLVVAKGAPVLGSVSVLDPDGDALTFELFASPVLGVASVDPGNGKFSYVPKEGAAGEDVFLIKVSDGTDYALVTIKVHNETELVIDTSNTNQVANQGKTLNGAVLASDADGDVLSYNISAEPTKGTLEINPNTGEWAYHCNSDATGTDSFEIAVTDGVKEKKVTFSLTINVPPKVKPESNFAFVTEQGVPYEGTISGEDIDGGELSYSVISQGKKGAVIIDSSTGRYRYIPNEGAAGDDTFVLGISDGIFVSQVTIKAHIETDIQIKPNPTTVVVSPGETGKGIIEASSADGDELSFSISTQGNKGQAAISSSGAWTYKADSSSSGSDSFVVSATDGTHTKYATVSIHIDTKPSFNSESISIEAAAFGKTTGKTVAVDGDGDVLTYSIVTNPNHGKATIDPKTGEYVYTNTAKATMDSFVVKASDTHGNSATLVINVKVNNPPVAPKADVDVKVTKGGSCSGKIVVTDMDGDSLTFVIGQNPKLGTVELNSETGEFVYKTNFFASGKTDSFVVEVSDGLSKTSVTVQVAIDTTAVGVASIVYLCINIVAFIVAVVVMILKFHRIRKYGEQG